MASRSWSHGTTTTLSAPIQNTADETTIIVRPISSKRCFNPPPFLGWLRRGASPRFMNPHYYNADVFAMNFEGRSVSFAQLLLRLLAGQARNIEESSFYAEREQVRALRSGRWLGRVRLGPL